MTYVHSLRTQRAKRPVLVKEAEKRVSTLETRECTSDTGRSVILSYLLTKLLSLQLRFLPQTSKLVASFAIIRNNFGILDGFDVATSKE